MNRLQLFVAFVAALLVASLAGTASAWRIYALSNNLDVWQGGRWSTIPLTFGNTTGTFFVDPPIAPTQVGQDRTGDVFLTALNGVPGRRPFVSTLKLDSATNAWAGTSFFIGRWGFDSANNFYSVNRFSPAPPVRNPIVKMASADYSDTSGGYIGHATATSDITPFRRGNAMVLVGNFTQVWDGNNTNPVEARNVALYDTRTGRWSAMGDGIPSPPSRIVSNGLQLVALVEPSTLWRWNGSNGTWRAYPLNLTSSRGDPHISDLDFGNEKLFLVGNFDRVNGVGVRNVSMLNFGVGGALTVKGIGIGLPGGSKTSIYARSSSQVFVGGSTNGWKVVYEWRKGRAVPWDRIGSLGFSPGTAPVVGLTVVN